MMGLRQKVRQGILVPLCASSNLAALVNTGWHGGKTGSIPVAEHLNDLPYGANDKAPVLLSVGNA